MKDDNYGKEILLILLQLTFYYDIDKLNKLNCNNRCFKIYIEELINLYLTDYPRFLKILEIKWKQIKNAKIE